MSADSSAHLADEGVTGEQGAVILCGGMDQSTQSIYNDVWVLDIASWAWRSVDVACGAVPEPRTGHCATALRDGMCIVGGANPEAGPLGDVWVLWMHSPQWFWQPVDVTPPLTPRELHAMTPLPPMEEDTATLRLAVWGGRSRSGMATSLQQLCVPTTTPAVPAEDGVPSLAGGTSAQVGAAEPGFAAGSFSVAVNCALLPSVLAAVYGGFDGSALSGSMALLATHATHSGASQAAELCEIDAGSAQEGDPPSGAHTDATAAVSHSMQVIPAAVQGSKAPPSFASCALPHASLEGALWVIGGLTGPQCADTVQLMQLHPTSK